MLEAYSVSTAPVVERKEVALWRNLVRVGLDYQGERNNVMFGHDGSWDYRLPAMFQK